MSFEFFCAIAISYGFAEIMPISGSGLPASLEIRPITMRQSRWNLRILHAGPSANLPQVGWCVSTAG